MGFSKKQHLQQNIDALRIAFKLEKEKRQATVGERLSLMRYSGFGGLKFVLNPIADETDINHWRKTDHDLFPITQELHQLLKENSEDDKQYRRYVDSMKSPVLTAFYTPPQVIDAISETLRESGVNIQKFLEPSAGIGSFIQSFSENQLPKITAYEKDLLTGKILKHLYPESTIRISGFEEIPDKEQNSYDIVASNIPFGDTSVFDLSFSRSKNDAKVQAARSVHNYFFLKGNFMLREGGLQVFITSQGVLNSPKNEQIRRALMENNNLVSVVRLPNNLFTEYAGTEVGSDLIILQKNTAKQGLTETEELFCQSKQTKYNTPSNAFFRNGTRVIHTDRKIDTDPYGQPAIIYTHKDGVEGIAKDEKLASMNFLNALEKLPSYIEQEQKKIAEIQKDLPVLQEVLNGTWSKENRLSELKTELAAVERKIQLSIKPETQNEAEEQSEKQEETSKVSESMARTKGVHLPRGVL